MTQPPSDNRVLSERSCEIATCQRPHLARGYCTQHYQRWKKTGDAETPSIRARRPAIIEGDIARIPIGINAKYGYAIVNADMAYLADKHNWHIHGKDEYVSTGKSTFLHHLVIGRPPKGMITDHINRNKMDNRRENLRHATYSVNGFNVDLHLNNTSGTSGVYYNKRDRRWVAEIGLNNKKRRLGGFITKDEAIAARKLAERNNLNATSGEE